VNRRAFVAGAVGALTLPVAAEAQPAGKLYRIGILGESPPPAPDRPNPFMDALRDGLRERGWVEGQHYVLERRYADGDITRLPTLAAELVRLPVDLILTTAGPRAPRAAKEATSTIPIVMLGASDPVGTGLVQSLARPGGNLTGPSDLVSFDIVSKHVELLKEVVPRISLVAYIYRTSLTGQSKGLKETVAAAWAFKVTLLPVLVDTRDQFPEAFATIRRQRAQGLIVTANPVTFANRQAILEFAAKSQLPAIYPFGTFVSVGGLMSYGVDYLDLFRRAGIYIDKILRGTNPGDLPIELPTKFHLALNLRTAKALGLTIPPAVLARADEVIQ
jgi:putative tryptophan/tyrosine transport system substrate-binding protein